MFRLEINSSYANVFTTARSEQSAYFTLTRFHIKTEIFSSFQVSVLQEFPRLRLSLVVAYTYLYWCQVLLVLIPFYQKRYRYLKSVSRWGIKKYRFLNWVSKWGIEKVPIPGKGIEIGYRKVSIPKFVFDTSYFSS